VRIKETSQSMVQQGNFACNVKKLGFHKRGGEKVSKKRPEQIARDMGENNVLTINEKEGGRGEAIGGPASPRI